MSIVTSLIGPVTGLLDKFIEDKDQKAQLAHEISTLSDKHAQELALAQVKAQHSRSQRKLVPVGMETGNRVDRSLGSGSQLPSVASCCWVRH